MFTFYKAILCIDQTRARDDRSVIGTQFVHFISIITACGLRKAFSKVEELRGMPYRTVMKKLKRASKVRDGGGEWRLGGLTGGREHLDDTRYHPEAADGEEAARTSEGGCPSPRYGASNWEIIIDYRPFWINGLQQ